MHYAWQANERREAYDRERRASRKRAATGILQQIEHDCAVSDLVARMFLE